jgi:hypothetical protein
MSADTAPTVALTIDEFIAIGEKLGALRGRVGWLECRVEELLRANNALIERARAAEARAGTAGGTAGDRAHKALAEFEEALKRHEHGGIAAWKFIRACREIFGAARASGQEAA